MSFKISYSLIFIIFLSALHSAVNAQKLPNKQETPVNAPPSIKIDGKANDWDSKYQAYNRAIQVFYTIANNKNNLCFIIKATDPLVIRKIIAGGITVEITTSPGTSENEKISITYPVFDKDNPSNINLRNKPISNGSSQMDSFMDLINKQIAINATEIKVSGIKAINDTVISIFNEENIKAAALFDTDIAYTYELSVPLKYLGLSSANPSILNYSISLNGSTHAEGAVIKAVEGGTLIESPFPDLPSLQDMIYISSPTKFNAEYILAK